jgi:hypothetical protein
MRRSMILSVLLGLLAIAVIGISAIGIYSYHLKRTADDAVKAVYEFSNRQHPPTIQEVRRRFGSALRQPDPCIAEGCGYDLLLSNRILAATHLVPYAALRSYYWTRNGIVDQSGLEFWTTARSGAAILAYVIVKYCEGCDSITINPSEKSSPLGTGSVEISYRSPAGLKRVALALNTWCLTGLSPCNNIADVFPDLWRITPERTIRCLIPNQYGVVDERNLDGR